MEPTQQGPAQPAKRYLEGWCHCAWCHYPVGLLRQHKVAPPTFCQTCHGIIYCSRRCERYGRPVHEVICPGETLPLKLGHRRAIYFPHDDFKAEFVDLPLLGDKRNDLIIDLMMEPFMGKVGNLGEVNELEISEALVTTVDTHQASLCIRHEGSGFLDPEPHPQEFGFLKMTYFDPTTVLEAVLDHQTWLENASLSAAVQRAG